MTNLQPHNFVPPGSKVYIEMYNVEVYKGILRALGTLPPPFWINPNFPSVSTQRVFLQVPDDNHLVAKIAPFRRFNNHPVFSKHVCYIKTSNNIIFKAELEPYHNQHFPNTRSRIFVQIPMPNNPIYTGVLQRSPSYVPPYVY